MSESQPSSPKLINLGCGRHYHPDWINIDLVSHDPQVIEYDLRQALPFESASVDAVYHSHVLEHLALDSAARFLDECYRVLKPGGVLRVVVPDLEQIARLYLESLDQAWNGKPDADFRYHWMKLELLDQMTRTFSGGLMGRVMTSCPPEQHDFLESRMGGEFRSLLPSDDPAKSSVAGEPARPKRTLLGQFQRKSKRLADRLVRSIIKRVYGKPALQRWDESIFRSQGEIHQWMYDRYSMRCVLEEIGFRQIRVLGPTESSIQEFARYGLDAINDRPRKPDSLFVEARRPAHAQELPKRAA